MFSPTSPFSYSKKADSNVIEMCPLNMVSIQSQAPFGGLRGLSEEAVRGDMFLSRMGARLVETQYYWFSWLMRCLFLFYALTSDLDLEIPI